MNSLDWVRLGRLYLTGIFVLIAAAGLAPSSQAARCISDAELEAVVGPQIAAGRFAIDTSKLPEFPMCSGLPVAQAIQQLHAKAHHPQGQASLPEPARSPQTDPGAIRGPLSSADRSAIERFIGRTAFDERGRNQLMRHRAVAAGLDRANVPQSLRTKLEDYAVTSAIIRDGDMLIDHGCMPHHCDSLRYRLFVDLRNGVVALCHMADGTQWYIPGPSSPLRQNSSDCMESPVQAPSAVRSALVSGQTPSIGASSAGGGTAVAARPANSFPQRFLARWEDKPGDCRLEFDDDGFVIEPRMIRYYETADEVDRLEVLSADVVRVSVHGSYGPDSWRETHTIRLLDQAQKITFVGSGKIYVRCAGSSTL